MKKQVGLWLDHRKAVMVILTDGVGEIKEIPSNVEKRIRYKSSRDLEDRTGEDVRDRRLENQRNLFYDEVIKFMEDAEAIQIFGPGEAKKELEKRIDQADLKAATITVESADKMTNRQISARVRDYFLK